MKTNKDTCFFKHQCAACLPTLQDRLHTNSVFEQISKNDLKEKYSQYKCEKKKRIFKKESDYEDKTSNVPLCNLYTPQK